MIEYQLSGLSDYYPDGFKVNIKTSDKPNENYTLLISIDSCEVGKGVSSAQLNLNAPLKVWFDILNGNDRVIKGIMEGRVKLRGIRPTFNQLIVLSSLLCLNKKE